MKEGRMDLVEQTLIIIYTFCNEACGTSYEDVLVMEERDDGKAPWRVLLLILLILQVMRSDTFQRLQEGGLKELLSP